MHEQDPHGFHSVVTSLCSIPATGLGGAKSE
jgi:hypothetical protein